MEKTQDLQTHAESKAQLAEQIKTCLSSGDYSRALDLLRGAGVSNDADLSELEKRAKDGLKRNAEANRLITESQELFALRKPAEAIQLLRKAYELDKNNSLARAILANALVEHAQSLVDTDWLKAETLTNQALALNPAHPTAKTILGLIVRKKETSSAEDWVVQARKLQSSGDLFGALAWVAEGLAVHPHDPGMLQIQDEIQRDQEARRRQARRGDVEELRRLQREIDAAADIAAKQSLAERIQAIAARHWTDGEILSIANALLLRLGLVPKENASGSTRGKNATVILHVPRPNAPQPSRGNGSATAPVNVPPVNDAPVKPRPIEAPPTSTPPIELPTSPVVQAPPPPTQIPPSPILQTDLTPSRPAPTQPEPSEATPTQAVPGQIAPSHIAQSQVPKEKAPTSEIPSKVSPGKIPLRTPPKGKIRVTPREPLFPQPLPTTVPAAEPSAPVISSSQHEQPTRSNSTKLLLASAAATILVAAILFVYIARRHETPPAATLPATAPAASTPAASPNVAPPAASVPAPVASTPAQTAPEPSLPASPDAVAGKITPEDQPPVEPVHNLGTLLVEAGQDDVRVFLNGKPQPQLTHSGQLRLPNLDPRDYVVQVSKAGFQDPPQQKIRIRKGEQARVVFNLQPQPRLASLTIQGGAPGTTVLVDQTSVGTIQPDGTLSVSAVNPGDHTVELRKDRFKPRQFKKHFVAGAAVSLAAADTALDAAPGELKITFTPPDANVAIVKGDLLKMVSSGVPLNLAAGTYTLTARTADRFTRSATLEVVAGQSRTLDFSLAPNGMSKWEDPGAWKPEKDSFVRKGGDFVLYGVAPASGTFIFSAMLTKGRLLQWVLDYTDARNYVLFQMDDDNFYRTVIRNGAKANETIIPDKSDKKSSREIHIRVSPTEVVHQIRHGNSWTVLDRWTQPGANLAQGKFGFYIPGNDQVALSSFAHYPDLNIR